MSNYYGILLNGTEHNEHIVRAEAARLLGDIGDTKAIPYLISMLKKDNWYSKVTAIYSLEKIGDPRAIPVLKEMAEDPLVFNFSGMYNHDMIRIAAAVALLKLGDKTGIEKIKELIVIGNSKGFLELSSYVLSLPDNEQTKPLKDVVSFKLIEKFSKEFQSGMQVRVLDALPYFKTAGSLSMIKKYLKNFSRYVRAKAAAALIKYGDTPAHRNILRGMLKKEKNEFVRIRLAVILKPDNTAGIIKKAIKNSYFFTRASAIDAAVELNRRDMALAILPLLKDPHFYVRLCAVEALEKFYYTEAAPAVKKLLKDENPRVRMQAAKYLANIPG